MKIAPALLATALLCAQAPAADAAPTQPVVGDHLHDFDFLVGQWKVHHWRLVQRLANNHDWIECYGTIVNWPTMNGHGNVDDTYIGLPSGPYYGVGIRGYDPKTQTWAIWWQDEHRPLVIEPPVFGNFKNGVGTFEGDDTFNGKPIKVRFVWTIIDANTAHWEQAFSPDGGKTWEVNWRQVITRASEKATP